MVAPATSLESRSATGAATPVQATADQTHHHDEATGKTTAEVAIEVTIEATAAPARPRSISKYSTQARLS